MCVLSASQTVLYIFLILTVPNLLCFSFFFFVLRYISTIFIPSQTKCGYRWILFVVWLNSNMNRYKSLMIVRDLQASVVGRLFLFIFLQLLLVHVILISKKYRNMLNIINFKGASCFIFFSYWIEVVKFSHLFFIFTDIELEKMQGLLII